VLFHNGQLANRENRAYDEAGRMLERHEHKGRLQRLVAFGNFTERSQPFAVEACSVQALSHLVAGPEKGEEACGGMSST
jgi:hypothetical protein